MDVRDEERKREMLMFDTAIFFSRSGFFPLFPVKDFFCLGLYLKVGRNLSLVSGLGCFLFRTDFEQE